MARGVNQHFLHLVQADRDTYRNWGILVGILAAALFAPAYFLYPWLGMAVHAPALMVGVVGGVLVAHYRAAAREDALAVDWNGWMAASVGKESIRSVWLAVHGKSNRNLAILAAMLGATFWTLQVIIVLLALSGPSLIEALPFLVVNGVLAGFLLGFLIRMLVWLKQFATSLEEMVETGEIGVWGVR